MKSFLILAATTMLALVASPNAEARPCSSHHRVHTFVSGHTSCGCPIYTQRHFSHYDRYGRVHYRYVRVPVRHRCRAVHIHRPSYRQPSCRQPIRRVAPRRCAPLPAYGRRIGSITIHSPVR